MEEKEKKLGAIPSFHRQNYNAYLSEQPYWFVDVWKKNFIYWFSFF